MHALLATTASRCTNFRLDLVEFGRERIQVFMTWFLYDWTPDLAISPSIRTSRRGLAIAESVSREEMVDMLPVRYIEQCREAHFNFHDVVSSRRYEFKKA